MTERSNLAGFASGDRRHYSPSSILTRSTYFDMFNRMNSIFSLANRINRQKQNIFNFVFPFGLFSQENKDGANAAKNMVIFLGNDFHNLPGANFQRAIELTNECLDFVRRECVGCNLFYKPHPAETDELLKLNLNGFSVMEKMPVELLYMKYAKNIRHVFSVCSLASRTAHEFGFNSLIFLEPVAPALGASTTEGFRRYLSVLPPECFIDDLSQPLRMVKDNKNNEDKSKDLERRIQRLVANRNGVAWMLVGDVNLLPHAKVMDEFIKKSNPEMQVQVVMPRHHRIETLPVNEIKSLFPNVQFIPRSFYSLRPRKVLHAWRTARLIRGWPIGKDDVIIAQYGLSFTDDCFASYFKHNHRVALMPKDFFRLASEEQKIDADRYRRRPGALFFNRVLEPLLGIERTEFFEEKSRSGWPIYRYSRPLNDIFDEVWVY